MSEELSTLKAIEAKLDSILKWTRFAGMQQLREILTQNLMNDTEMLVYELSDGEKSTREIAKLVGVGSNATIAALWKKWSKVGIMEPSHNYKGRYQRICSLEDVGLVIPPMPKIQSSQDETEEEEEIS